MPLDKAQWIRMFAAQSYYDRCNTVMDDGSCLGLLADAARESLSLSDRVKELEGYIDAFRKKNDELAEYAGAHDKTMDALHDALGLADSEKTNARGMVEDVRQLRFAVEGLRVGMRVVAEVLGCEPESGAMVRRVMELRGKVKP